MFIPQNPKTPCAFLKLKLKEMEEELLYVSVELPDEYVYVLMLAAILTVEAMIVGCILPGKSRKDTYL